MVSAPNTFRVTSPHMNTHRQLLSAWADAIAATGSGAVIPSTCSKRLTAGPTPPHCREFATTTRSCSGWPGLSKVRFPAKVEHLESCATTAAGNGRKLVGRVPFVHRFTSNVSRPTASSPIRSCASSVAPWFQSPSLPNSVALSKPFIS